MNGMTNIVYNQWIDCTDENYWQTDTDIVCYMLEDDFYINTKRNCPYGWNVLCRLNAKFMSVENPFKNLNNSYDTANIKQT